MLARPLLWSDSSTGGEGRCCAGISLTAHSTPPPFLTHPDRCIHTGTILTASAPRAICPQCRRSSSLAPLSAAQHSLLAAAGTAWEEHTAAPHSAVTTAPSAPSSAGWDERERRRAGLAKRIRDGEVAEMAVAEVREVLGEGRAGAAWARDAVGAWPRCVFCGVRMQCGCGTLAKAA